MQIDREDIRRQYAAMADEELLELNPEDLTEVARECYTAEVAARKLDEAPAEAEEAELADSAEYEEDADWLDTAAVACTFQAVPGRHVAPEAARACEFLRAAGIPSHIGEVEPDWRGDSGGLTEYQVLVPAGLTLKAASVLDRQMFNVTLEETWKAHLEQLSDEELRLLTPGAICEGYLDRAARLKRVYLAEVARRAAPST